MRRSGGRVPSSMGPGQGEQAAALEQEWLQRLRQRDEAAFVALVDAYHARLLRTALTLVGQRSVAEEVVQDTWLAVLGGLEHFEGRSSLKTWLFRILMNRARTRAEKEGRMLPFSALAPVEEDAAAVAPERFTPEGAWAAPPASWGGESPEAVAMRSQALGVLEQALEELPAGQRTVVTLRDVEGLESVEVCEVLQISEANQRVLLHRGRARLRQALEERFGKDRSDTC